jgi:hypothetical protein
MMMNDDIRRDREVGAWIRAEAPERAPDRLRNTIRSELAQTRQERGPAMFSRWGPLLSPARTAIAGVLVLAVAVVTIGLLGNRSPVANARPTPAPTSTANNPSPAVSPAAVPTLSGIDLPAGVATTNAFRPTLRFTVPAGWIKTEDTPLTLHLAPPNTGYMRQADGRVEFDAVNVYARPLAGQPDGGLSAVAGVGRTAKELATWLSTRPQLIASKPKQVTYAGRPGYQLDFRLSPNAGSLCGELCVNLLNSPDRGASYQFGIEGSWQVRAILLVAPDGSTVMITVEDADGIGFDREIREAQPVLDSLSFPG